LIQILNYEGLNCIKKSKQRVNLKEKITHIDDIYHEYTKIYD